MAIHNINDERPSYDLRAMVRRQRDEQKQADTMHIRNTTEEIEISTDDVVIEKYQRNFSPKWARWIAKNFDLELFDKPLVAPIGNGKYAVIDGQHRIAALKIRFAGQRVTFIADVDHTATSLPKQAKRFTGRNHHVRKTGIGDHLRALLVQGDEDALAFDAVLQDAGYKVKWGGGKTRPGSVPPAVFKSIRDRCPGTWQRDLADALAACNGAWGLSDFPLDTDFIVGLALFLRAYRDDAAFDRKRFIGKLSEHMPRALYIQGRTLKDMGQAGRNDYGVRKVLVSVYNHGAHSRKLEA